jgi:hypothetical protein
MAESKPVEQGDQKEMTDPIIGTALAKAIGSAAGSESEKAATNLFMRVFGPSADEIGEALRRYTAYKLRNVGKIVESAAAKSSTEPVGGMVNTRVAYVILEEGALCDDDLMANYLGGVLAGGRSRDGRDDRAVAWSRIITGLSSLQIRAHYLLYREWAVLLHGATEKSMQTVNLSKHAMIVDQAEFRDLLVSGSSVDSFTAMAHSIYGLASAGLLGSHYGWSGRTIIDYITHRRPFPVTLQVEPTNTGLELYGWAQGLPGITSFEFPELAQAFDTKPPIPRLSSAKINGR